MNSTNNVGATGAGAGVGRTNRWREALRFSIKARLVLLFLLLALATTAVFVFGTQRLLQTGWEAFAKPLVADYVDRLAAEIGSPPDVVRAQALTERLPISVRISGASVQFDSRPVNDRNQRHSGSNDRASHHDDNDHDSDSDSSDARGGWRQRSGSTPFILERLSADGHRIRFGLARPPDPLRPHLFGWATLAMLLLLTALAYLATRRLLAPLDSISRGVESYGRGEFDSRIPVARRDELGRLAERINGMASNLHGMLEAKRALLLAISHELRSPLTRARLNTELLGDSAPRQALLRDLAEMRDLIDNLLESERLALGHSALQAEPVDLPALVRELVADRYAGSRFDLQIDDMGPGGSSGGGTNNSNTSNNSVGPIVADPTRLRLLLKNLIDNAARHASAAHLPPVVFLQRQPDGRIALGVRDFGPGVSSAQLQQLGQPFFRTDSARSRARGGVGLGLTLARGIAEAHGGELLIENAEPGLRVSAVWLPQRV